MDYKVLEHKLLSKPLEMHFSYDNTYIGSYVKAIHSNRSYMCANTYAFEYMQTF